MAKMVKADCIEVAKTGRVAQDFISLAGSELATGLAECD